jgi:hypothetical protein
MLKPEQKQNIEDEVSEVAEKHCLDNPACWRHCGVSREWLNRRTKEALNALAGRGIKKYQVGPLTQENLFEIAKILKLEADPHKIVKTILWQQIVDKVKLNEDTLLNRLLKIWTWLEARITDKDMEYLQEHGPGYWEEKECYAGKACYLDPDWRARHLTTIFETTFIIQDVVNAKMNAKERTSVVSGLSKLQLWLITHEIMNLEKVPHSATKKVMWKAILEKLEGDIEETNELLKQKK